MQDIHGVLTVNTGRRTKYRTCPVCTGNSMSKVLREEKEASPQQKEIEFSFPSRRAFIVACLLKANTGNNLNVCQLGTGWIKLWVPVKWNTVHPLKMRWSSVN